MNVRKPTYLGRLPEIRAALETLPGPYVDRRTVQQVLKLSSRQTQRLLLQWGIPVLQAGDSYLFERVTLVLRLQQLEQDPDTQWAVRRIEKVEQQLAQVKLNQRAAAVQIRVDDSAFSQVMATLPKTIVLQPGLLRIEFFGAEDLLYQLVELGQAMMNDFDRFKVAVEGPE